MNRLSNESSQSVQVSAYRQATGPYRTSTAAPRAGGRLAPAILAVAVVLSLGGIDASRGQAAAALYSPAEAGFWSEVRPARPSRISRPSAVRRHRAPQAAPQAERAPAQKQQQTLRTPRVPRGSGGYVAPIALPQAGVTTPPAAQPYQPPPINTFSDRVNSAIQAYPLQKGIGNNPVDQQEFIRQRANQP